MTALQDARRKLSHTELLDALTDRRRRQILRVLLDQSEPVTERELTERLVVDGDTALEDAAEAIVEGIQIQVQHVHLPRLDDAGLVDWDEDEGAVTMTDDPVYDEAELEGLLEVDDGDWDGVADGLTDERRRRILSVLESAGESVRRDALAHEIAARETDGEAWANAVESVRTELHHVHLPKLDGAGLVEYDVDDGTVTHRGHPSGDAWQR